MKILIINRGWSDNYGDQAIKICLEYLCGKCNCEASFIDITSRKIQKINQFKKRKKISAIKRLIPRKLVWYLFNKQLFEVGGKKYSNVDLVIIGGGQLFLNNGIFSIAMHKWVNIFREKEIVLFGIGVGDNFSILDKLLYKRVLGIVKRTYLRDRRSISNIEKFFQIKSLYVPDVAFLINLIFPGSRVKEKSVLLCVTDYYVYKLYNKNNISKREYFELWINRAKEYSEKGYSINLGYATNSDFQQTIEFAGYLSKNYKIEYRVKHADNIQEFIRNISSSEIVISGRMHTLIFGFTYGCKIEPFILSNKIASFKDEVLDSGMDISTLQRIINNKFNEIIKW